MKIVKRTLVLVFLILAAGFWYVQPLLKIVTGYTAKMACTCHYMQGRSIESIHDRDLVVSVMPMLSQSLIEDQNIIKSSFFGLVTAEAQFVKGHGCILLAKDQVVLPTAKVISNPPISPLAVFDTLPTAVQLNKISRAMDTAFVPVAGGETRAVAVLYDGRLISERYADGFDKDIPQLGWSMTKSITNALVAIMVKNGKLALNQNHLFSEWENDKRSEITVNNLMHMNSGLEWNETYGNESDATSMLFRKSDMGAYALDKPLAFERDSHWAYSSGTTNILSKLIRQTLKNDDAYHALLQDSLFTKLGMHSAFVEMDQSGNFVGSSYGWATAQDWAKFGQLYLQDGVWNGERLLPEGWVDYSRQAANGSKGIYGAQIWLKVDDEPDAPDDIFAFHGYQGQRVIVIPSRNCVIVRLGKNDDVKFDFNSLITNVLAGLPE